MHTPFHHMLPSHLLETAERLFKMLDAPPPASLHFYFEEIQREGSMDWLKLVATMLPLSAQIEFEKWIVAQENHRAWAKEYAVHQCEWGNGPESERGAWMLDALSAYPAFFPKFDEFKGVGDHDVIATPARSIEFGLVSLDDAIIILETLTGEKHFVICPLGVLKKALENIQNETL